MTDKHREDNGREKMDASSKSQRQQEAERDDLTRRRELAREGQLTNREREERWPIG